MIASIESLIWAVFAYLQSLLLKLFAGGAVWAYFTHSNSPSEAIDHPSRKQEQKTALAPYDDFLARIKTISGDHEIAGLLQNMIEHDGAGSWPPKASSDVTAWPAALRPYHEIYLELAPMLSVTEVSLDDEVNAARCRAFREKMRTMYAERVDVKTVEALLAGAEAGDNAVPKDVYNRLFSCIAMSRHAFRWGTIPVVKLAQKENMIDLPPALLMPWTYFRRHYGLGSNGGNVMANFLCNFGADGIVYQINQGKAPVIRSAEYWFAFMFLATEKEAVPAYYEIVQCIAHYERGQRDACLASLRRLNEHVRAVMKVFYDNMVTTKISREVWMSYVQGFQAWGAGEYVDGEYVEDDGVSANQLPFFHVVDAFLGMGTYLTPEEMDKSVPMAQKRLSYAVRKHCFRDEVKAQGDAEIEAEMQNMVKQLRVFRSAHKVRAVPYLKVPAPERFIMTAGKSVLDNRGIHGVKAAIEFLENILIKRMKETQ